MNMIEAFVLFFIEYIQPVLKISHVIRFTFSVKQSQAICSNNPRKKSKRTIIFYKLVNYLNNGSYITLQGLASFYCPHTKYLRKLKPPIPPILIYKVDYLPICCWEVSGVDTYVGTARE